MDNSAKGKLSRRAVLRNLGVAGVSTGFLGEVSAKETERRIVGVESKRAAERVKRRADRVVRELDFGDIGYTVVGYFPTDAKVEFESASESQSSDVRYVETESQMKLLGERESDLEESQSVPWGVEEIGASELHDEGTTGAGAHIAIIDSGIDSDHPDLQGNLGKGKGIVPCGAGEDDEEDESPCRRSWDDGHNHGTHVAGIADATSNDTGIVGVSTEATLHSVKVMSADGHGDSSTIAEGFKWAADQGYDVANMSIGDTEPSEVMHDAVKYADQKGMLMVAAAGNENEEEKTVHYPGAFPEVICVGAVNEDGDMYENSLEGEEVELVAPGEDIRSCVRGGYEVYSGTSMATPHVTGAAALLFGEGYSKDEVRKKLRETATDLDHDEDEQGYGLVNPSAALGKGGDEPMRDSFGVTAHGATDVEKQAATLDAELGLGDHSSATVGFEYWVAGDESTKQTVEVGQRSSPGMFSAEVTSLETETEYAFVAFATDGDERVTSDQQTFTTVGEPEEPTRSVVVQTDEVSDVDEDEAELNGRVTEMRGVDALKAYFEYWAKGHKDATYVRMPVDVLDDPDDFDEDAEDLQSDTTYVARAQCVSEDGNEMSGDTVEFTTEVDD